MRRSLPAINNCGRDDTVQAGQDKAGYEMHRLNGVDFRLDITVYSGGDQWGRGTSAGGGLPVNPKFSPVRKWSSCRKIFVQKCKI